MSLTRQYQTSLAAASSFEQNHTTVNQCGSALSGSQAPSRHFLSLFTCGMQVIIGKVKGSVLLWAGVEVILFIVAAIGLCFGFVLETILITEGCFHNGQRGLTQSQGLLCT